VKLGNGKWGTTKMRIKCLMIMPKPILKYKSSPKYHRRECIARIVDEDNKGKGLVGAERIKLRWKKMFQFLRCKKKLN
jgi:hypothetical protein